MPARTHWPSVGKVFYFQSLYSIFFSMFFSTLRQPHLRNSEMSACYLHFLFVCSGKQVFRGWEWGWKGLSLGLAAAVPCCSEEGFSEEPLMAWTCQSARSGISCANHSPPFHSSPPFSHSWKEAGWQIEGFSLKGEWRAL